MVGALLVDGMDRFGGTPDALAVRTWCLTRKMNDSFQTFGMAVCQREPAERLTAAYIWSQFQPTFGERELASGLQQIL